MSRPISPDALSALLLLETEEAAESCRQQVRAMLTGYGRAPGWGPGPLRHAEEAATEMVDLLRARGWDATR